MAERPMKSNEWVSGELFRHISEGRYKTGDKLPSVVDLAVEYSVGRSTIREALSALKARGLLDIRQGGGTYVKEAPSEEELEVPFFRADWTSRAESLRHVLEVRKVLETGCAALAARNRTNEDIAALRGIIADMENHVHDESFGEQADIRLHSLIARATRNPALVEMMSSLSQRMNDSMKDTRALWFYAEVRSAERLLKEHSLIVDAIEAHDEAKAAALMEAHLNKVEQVLKEKSGALE